MKFKTRFAPSPTGPLHLGHAYSALLANDLTAAEGGRFLLRIDDLDQTRSRPEWEAQLKDDLGWLGLRWPEPCRRESDCTADYDAALDRLWGMGLIYPCTCTRHDIRDAANAPQEGIAAHGPDGLIYPGTCRGKTLSERDFSKCHLRPRGVTLRLDMARACSYANGAENKTEAPNRMPKSFANFHETGHGPNGETGLIEVSADTLVHGVGDVVLARQGGEAAYHLAVVVDDAAQDISHVVRGQDLFDATQIHIMLQRLLDLPTPIYHHHGLIRDDMGKRLAKRDDARAIAKYRTDGATPQEIRRLVGLD
ncbi:tRNA glutamyl-Q(34) synthetase GluQRS [Roseovarius pelagicus]|uniref:tRNA glutamyl-Q(34) synthetase GluQRS n=1 Tax=Roseovarius pelagicus TaxID=2980108 RepID=A0ABY6DIS6_9RHOB|nr:tRNA glutamyl-Q(34) synthetase GluQRS [Roseovarius pelagicus]UXX83705.1 tRNA glutamyl-Q(34) synthetase GluQRS [Roseovarius pelagicus]